MQHRNYFCFIHHTVFATLVGSPLCISKWHECYATCIVVCKRS